MTARAAPASRRAAAEESFRTAGECIGEIARGMSVFAITRGQFSMIDVILYCLDRVGAGAGVSVWTWAIADYEVEVFERLLIDGRIGEGRLVVDYSAGRRNRELLDVWRDRFGEGAVKVCMNHAKIARIWGAGVSSRDGGEFKLLARGSFNLNFNPRFEQFDLTEGGRDYDLVERIEMEIPVLPREHSKQDAKAASRVERSFSFGGDEALNVFEAEKVFEL